MIGNFYLIFKKRFNNVPDISKAIICLSELSRDSVFFILSFLEDDFSNIESFY